MASLYIAEFSQLAYSHTAAVVMAPQCPPVAEQKLTISGSSTPSAAFNAATRYVMIETDAICSIAWSSDSNNPTATTSNMRLGAGDMRFFGVPHGAKLAVIANT